MAKVQIETSKFYRDFSVCVGKELYGGEDVCVDASDRPKGLKLTKAQWKTLNYIGADDFYIEIDEDGKASIKVSPGLWARRLKALDKEIAKAKAKG